jgi:hypothetical protein
MDTIGSNKKFSHLSQMSHNAQKAGRKSIVNTSLSTSNSKVHKVNRYDQLTPIQQEQA